ncbi:MAG TPA: AraC family transcriptional regulator, partial [Bacteroidia bacterium]
MKLQIKNMVSMRCKLMLQNLVNKFGLHIKIIKLGELDITEELDKTEKAKFRTALREIGLDIIDDKRLGLIEHIKNVVVEMVHHADEMPKVNFSNHLSETLGYDYTYMANVFSETEGITIEQFVILHKVERIKELITNGELNITEIAFKMNYSSVGHLSSQFKKSTGF